MQQPAPVTPVPFFDAVVAYQRSAAIKTAIELGIFTAVGEVKTTAAAIAEAVDANARGVRILSDALTVMGFLTKSGDNYALTDVSAAFLDGRSPSYAGAAVDFLMSDAQRRGFEDLTNTVRRGGSANSGDASMDPNSEMWVKFARGMAAFIFPMAEAAAANIGFPADAPIKVLDIAAGHGLFGVLTAKRYPNAEVFGADWPNVLDVAVENASKFGVGERYHTIPGNAFETEFGKDYDVILVPNFLHHFDADTCSKFLGKCEASLKPDGKVVTVEFIPNDDRISPPMAAMFPLVMLAGTPAGDAYTFAELKKMAEDAGFSRNERVSLDPLPSDLMISMR
jgi:2-polyprenyl-3-methyl-5-hydroxy-6-metoxy-1,4-benzoquinol methylase